MTMATMDGAALEYELAAEDTVTGDFTAEVVAAVAVIVAAYAVLSAQGALTDAAVAGLRTLIRRTLGAITPNMRPELIRQVNAGVTLGVNQSMELALASDLRRPEPGRIHDPALLDAVGTIDTDAERTLEEAIRLADALDLADEDNLNTVAAKATKASTDSRATTRWSANRAVNEGAYQVAKTNGLHLLWAGERNACLKCLAYFGLTAVPGELFPAGLTFGSKPSKLPGVPFPPLHPWCRCRVVPVTIGPVTNDLAAGLAREARRTVVRGWSGFDSKPERLRAADTLIQRGADLPKTVVARAMRDVRRKAFSQRHRPLTTLTA